ncbi:inositol monophosphatase family protein [Conexibacter sp. DBS9H8]|uniref:inositol monophosphatase family protein n=1 Tax=Conexibacter sp. DBS9H8 TaxID=2937801 RepID=UPI00200F6A8F|nr:inositol monophosphatase family protein [Conexibacter sp. DBS9H8]
MASILASDWLVACRSAVTDVRSLLESLPSIADRAVETGTVGSGGDDTLMIDAAAEEAIFAQLDALHAGGLDFTAVSEERGEVSFGGGPLRVVIDPIDGSLNAKRGLPHHALSIAVADGPLMSDVRFGYVFDFGPEEEWWASEGAGAFCNGRRLDPSVPERRGPTGRLEVLGIESADPRWVAAAAEPLAASAYRLRALGTIAAALCQVAAGRLDGLVSLRACRAVDAAAGQLIVREGGGAVAFPACDAPLGAPLDVIAHSPVVAARSEATVQELALIPASGTRS